MPSAGPANSRGPACLPPRGTGSCGLLQELSLCVPLSLGFDSLPHRPHSGVEQGRLKGGTPKHGSFAFISFIFLGFSRDFARKKKSPAKLNV